MASFEVSGISERWKFPITNTVTSHEHGVSLPNSIALRLTP